MGVIRLRLFDKAKKKIESIGITPELRLWQDRARCAQDGFQFELDKMDYRDMLYRGTHHLKRKIKEDTLKETVHVRNIVSENIETLVQNFIPQPKVTALREQDVEKAQSIEAMLKNELDRLPIETINNLMERIVPIQGGGAYILNWDSDCDNVVINVLHPKQILPQDGVYDIDDMDYIILMSAQTKEYILKRFGVDVSNEYESNPEIKSTYVENQSTTELVTLYTAYYKNEHGGIGTYSWVNNIELESLDNYQARKVKKCLDCGESIYDDSKKCPVCGSKNLELQDEEFEDLYEPAINSKGEIVAPGLQVIVPQHVESQPIYYDDGSRAMIETPVTDEFGMPSLDMFGNPITETQLMYEEYEVEAVTEPTKIPRYVPNIYPVVWQKNISSYGRFMGESDVDKIADHQNTINRLHDNIYNKLIKSGSYLIGSIDTSIPTDVHIQKKIVVGSIAEAEQLKVIDMQGDISKDLAMIEHYYNESRQILNITDSFQGRRDTTATSGRAKEFQAAQTAGRLESKLILKEYAYSKIYEIIFKYKLAYIDDEEEMRIDGNLNDEFTKFNRFDFLEKDKLGEYYWNDKFLFSTDSASSMSNNRQAMWEENRLNLQQGAFGDPTNIDTLIFFWRKMELDHYPGAASTKNELIKQKEERAAMEQQMMMEQQMQQQIAMQQAVPQGQPNIQGMGIQ